VSGSILDRADGERVRSSYRGAGRRVQHPALLEALLAGEVVHFDDTRVHYNASELRKTYDVIVRTKLDGNGGRYWWAVPVEETAAP
jgi:hypothetical protein